MVRFSQTLDDAPSRNQKKYYARQGERQYSFLDQNRLKDQFVGMRNMLSLRPMNRLM